MIYKTDSCKCKTGNRQTMTCILLAKLIVCKHCVTYGHHWIIENTCKIKHLQFPRLNNHHPFKQLSKVILMYLGYVLDSKSGKLMAPTIKQVGVGLSASLTPIIWSLSIQTMIYYTTCDTQNCYFLIAEDWTRTYHCFPSVNNTMTHT